MGLLYTKQYIDFEEDEWKQISNEPPIFETIQDGVSLEITDTTHKQYKLKFKQGAKLKIPRVVGKFRLTWDDDFLLE